jgi:acyl-CoA thioesterase
MATCHEPIFRREGPLYRPSANAPGPWAADKLHGGPVLGLLARAIEAAVPDPDLLLARLTVDMFRPVPAAPLGVRTALLRQGSRLTMLDAALLVADEPHVRASALFLRAADVTGQRAATSARPSGPDGLPTESLMRGFPGRDSGFPPGFHTCAETRWVPRTAAEPLAIWFRLPVPLVEAEPDSPTVRAIALSDFANAVASIAAHAREPSTPPYINADVTLYMHRRPEGEWFCLQEQGASAERGVSVTQAVMYDEQGPFGRALQARLTNSYKQQ